MESNKDEAERCISIALKAIQSNQPDRALRFLEKAQRLYPTPRVHGECKMPETLRGHKNRWGEYGNGPTGVVGGGGGVARRGYACALRRAVAFGRCSLWRPPLSGILDTW